VRPNRYALARSLGVPLQPDELALHECDIPLWAPAAAHPRHPAHVLALTAANDVLARRVRRADRRVIPSDGLRAESLVVRVDLVSTMLRAGRPPSITAVSVAPSCTAVRTIAVARPVRDGCCGSTRRRDRRPTPA
jgi:hypothetical protein